MTTDGPPAPASSAAPRGAIGCITVPFLLLALVCLGWGARLRWSDGVLLRNGVTVQGRVTELRHVFGQTTVSGYEGSERRGLRRRRRTATPGRALSPVVAYTTRTGEQRTAVGSVNRSPAEYEVGDPAVVVYDPANPQRADLRSELLEWWFWLAVWTLSAVTLAAFACVPVAIVLYQLHLARRGG